VQSSADFIFFMAQQQEPSLHPQQQQHPSDPQQDAQEGAQTPVPLQQLQHA
jgi:hypothetical protein